MSSVSCEALAKLGELMRRVGPPPGLRARIRWLFLCLTGWMILTMAPQIPFNSHSSAPIKAATVASLGVLLGLQIVGYRAGGFRLAALEALVEGALVAGASILHGDIHQVFALFIVPLYFRSLYGSVWQTGWTIASYTGAFLAVVLAWPAAQGNPPTLSQAELVANVMSIVSSGLLMTVITYATRSHERAERRADTLARAGAELVAAGGRAEVFEAALQAASALVSDAGLINVCLSVQTADDIEIVAAHGRDATRLLGLHLQVSDFPAEHVLRSDRQRVVLDAAATAEVQSSLGLPVHRAILSSFLLSPNDTKLGVLAVETEAPLSPQTADALGMLASEVALAFDAVRLHEHLHEQAYRDPLTGLANRARFVQCLEQALADTRRRGATLVMLFLDLDNFKVVNDSLGHAAGDELLCAIARRLRASVRPSDVVSRLGGDEFAVVLEDVADIAEARRASDRIAAEVWQPISLEGHSVTVTGSIGIALSSGGGGDFSEMLRAADLALYTAKNAGKAQAAVFDASMIAASRRRLDLEADLRQALDRQEFEVYYQPLVRLRDGQIGEVEALVRWNHPGRGVVGPVEFIPVAEETGMIVALGRHVLEVACRRVKAWQDARPMQPPLMLAVNLSGRQLQDSSFVVDVRAILRASGLPATSLKLEITESLAVADTVGNRRALNELRDMGVRLAIDDFGTGTSAIDYLRRYPVDALKIDRSFIAELGHDERTSALVRAIVAFGNSLGLSVTAEGIETVDQSAQLRAMGCEWGQGYLFARPIVAERMAELLQSAAQTAAA